MRAVVSAIEFLQMRGGKLAQILHTVLRRPPGDLAQVRHLRRRGGHNRFGTKRGDSIVAYALPQ